MEINYLPSELVKKNYFYFSTLIIHYYNIFGRIILFSLLFTLHSFQLLGVQ